MTSQQTQAERFDDRVCGVCACCATGYGYAPGYRWRGDKPVLWVCDDPQCLKTAKDSYTMRQEEFTRLERIAAHDSRFDIGDFLQRIGKTDMAAMSEEEAMELCRITVAAYRRNLKKLIGEEAPF